MIKNKVFIVMAICFALSVFAIRCNLTTNESGKAKPDMAKIKTEIQALNTIWANAVNTKDAATIMSLYADDAISMPDDEPSLIGKAAIQKDVEVSTANSKGVVLVTYITEEVFGDEQMVTERGKVIAKDTSGNLVYTEKYIQIWEKRNNKWQVLREIYNLDAKQK